MRRAHRHQRGLLRQNFHQPHQPLLVALYQQKHTLPKDAAAVAKPGEAGTAAPSNEPMTAKAYAQAVEALRQKLGNRTEGSPEYAALQSQRLAARRAGY